jgi:hypothetical protein
MLRALVAAAVPALGERDPSTGALRHLQVIRARHVAVWRNAEARLSLLLGGLLFAGAFLLAATWDTAGRLPAVAGLVLFYGAATALAWRRFQRLAALGDHAFAGLREELAADAALLRSNL